MSTGDTQPTPAYRSIFLADDWAHQRYFGWRVVEDRPGLRVLAKRRAIVTRYLVLLTAAGRGALDQWLAAQAGLVDLTDIIIHDFDGVLAEPVLSGRTFHRAASHERLLNTATFVIDLRQSEEALMSAMSSDYRRKIRKAEAGGCTVTAYAAPPADLVSGFLAALTDFSGERGLNIAEPATIAAMYGDGRAILLVARKNGEAINYLHLYKAGDAASFMYGVSLSKENDGAGQYLHWQAMRHLKAEGLDWYDLGGVASTSAEDGIFTFKQRFGGQLVDLGPEWRSTSAVAARGQALAGSLKALARGRTR